MVYVMALGGMRRKCGKGAQEVFAGGVYRRLAEWVRMGRGEAGCGGTGGREVEGCFSRPPQLNKCGLGPTSVPTWPNQDSRRFHEPTPCAGLHSTELCAQGQSCILPYLEQLFERDIVHMGTELQIQRSQISPVFSEWMARLTHPHFGLSCFFVCQDRRPILSNPTPPNPV